MHAGPQDCPSGCSSSCTQLGDLRYSGEAKIWGPQVRDADAYVRTHTAFSLQNKEQVLADVRSIIAEQLGAELDTVSAATEPVLGVTWARPDIDLATAGFAGRC